MSVALSTLPFRTTRSSALGNLSLAIFYVAIYLKDWASPWMSTALAGVLLGIALALGSLALWLRAAGAPLPAWRGALPVLTALLFTWVLTLSATLTVNTSSYYLAIPCAIVIANLNAPLFTRLLVLHLVLTIGVQAYEYFSGQYLFIYQADDGTALDETLFGGGLDVFRAKGLFQGPLSAVAFALWMAFLYRASLGMVAALFLCAFFASGRLGMLTSVVLIAIRLFAHRARSHSFVKQIPLLLVLLATAALLFLTSDENRLFFISNALDVDNTQNESRVFTWLISLSQFLSYGPIDLLLGNFGFVKATEGSTENDFLRLLLDCGLFGFLLYAAAIVALFNQARRAADAEGMLTCVLIIVLMNIFPFVQSLSSALLFWLYYLSRMNRPHATRAGRKMPATRLDVSPS
jgi:hypothetical protein